MMSHIFNDVRVALRTLGKNPGFAATAIVTLALGIGATTAMFTVVDGVLLKPLRYRDADRIVALSTVFTDRGRTIPRLTGGDYLDIKSDGDTFESIANYYGGEMGVQVADRAEFVSAILVNTDFLNVFGVTPLAGRLFNADDAQQSAIVSATFASRNFGTAERAVGQRLHLEDRTYAIVGVLHESFQFPERAEVWIAAAPTPYNVNRTSYNFRAVAKLRQGVPVESANAKLSTLATQLAAAYPDSNTNKSFSARSLREQLVVPVRTTLVVLMGAVGLVLLIACANVANLLLARATARSREMAVRSALGASRWQVVRQLLAESLVLALGAGILGVIIASVATDALLLRGGSGVALPRLADVTVDWRVLLFAIGLCCASSVVFGLAPAFEASRVNLSDALKQAGARGVLGGQFASLRGALVVAQIALSFVLVIGAGLLFRSLLALTSVELGFRSDAMLVMYAHAPARTRAEYIRVTQFEDELFERIRHVPGVVSVAGAMGLPTGQYGIERRLRARRPGHDGASRPGTAAGHLQSVERRLFFDAGDSAGAGTRLHRSGSHGQHAGRDRQRGARAAEFPERGPHRPPPAVRPGRREHELDDHRRPWSATCGRTRPRRRWPRRCTCRSRSTRFAPTRCRSRSARRSIPRPSSLRCSRSCAG
jgi:predicted permease